MAKTSEIFTNPREQRTKDYITGRYGSEGQEMRMASRTYAQGVRRGSRPAARAHQPRWAGSPSMRSSRGDALPGPARHRGARARSIADDKRIDALEARPSGAPSSSSRLRAPMADDLRDVVAALKIAGVVERIGDYAKNIAKRVPLLENAGKIEPLSLLPEMARIAARWCTTCSTPSSQRDAERRSRCASATGGGRFLQFSIFRTLLTHMMENPHNITPATHLLFVAKNLERIGDHATNIAEMVYFAATGQHMAERPRGEDPPGWPPIGR
jgi:phosphate transport system protein